MKKNMLKTIIMALMLAFTANSAKAATLKGDINGDNILTVSDVTMLVNIVLGNGEAPNFNIADVNGDGAITVSDVTMLINKILTGDTTSGTETGDITDDPATGDAQSPAGLWDDSME